MTIQAEAHALIVEAIDRLPNKRAVAKQLFDAIRPRDGDTAHEALAVLGSIVGVIWNHPMHHLTETDSPRGQ